ncbi:MAG: tRNA (adenosine(37)-N6)-threonylcarbamoyltransferase complex ATPase subunit type 1 TsaE [Rhizobiaceae bacterium]|nr:tRNA (adenosine(37)-N6)-threonylcarbamoyltransferase complex ATPase subunit type 1 TsaE [Rhizobiaceae bacterium]MCV0404705.1 tRNA (adenosine(37)-N6)-threonylcarbamoyltransferase complex ATPase subunit type 1 TsaE [Rhizobiaceae bacterium]
MVTVPLSIPLPDEAATAALGRDLAQALRPGDLIALSGELGAGKSTLVREAIRSLSSSASIDIPSPTFTLIQPYDTLPPLLHADLYRIGSDEEVGELGIGEWLEKGAVLVEWPERAGAELPQATLTISIFFGASGRVARIEGTSEAMERLSRSREITAFLEYAGWGGARRSFLLGDASTRAYELVVASDGGEAILMNAPGHADGPPLRDGRSYSRIAHLAENVVPFVAVARALRQAQFCAPEIFAQDLDAGLLLIEHLGHEPFLGPGGEPVPERYFAAARLLADLHSVSWNPFSEAAPGIRHYVPDYDRGAMMIEVELLLDWYLPYTSGEIAGEEARGVFVDTWRSVLDGVGGAGISLVLRDYHSPNIVWRGDREGRDRLGLVDFQDAVMGPLAYDVASLAQDARVSISTSLEAEIVAVYCAAREAAGRFDRDAFLRDYAIMAAQRNSKILGIFVRLDRRDGKPGYLKHLPRIRDYTARSLAHRALAPLRPFYASIGIEPEPVA